MFKKYLPLILIIVFFSFLFFFRLGWPTLVSWDEAWYASISREIAKTGDFMNLKWNGSRFWDHPPAGFWLISLSYKIFGVNEFATRLPSAILGLLTIILIYLSGEWLFKKKSIAFVASMIMGTCVWYVLRARSGNLDSTLIFFYIMTIYFSLRSSHDFKFFPLAMSSFALLILSKTLIGVPAIVLVLFLNFNQIIKFKENKLFFLCGLACFILIVFPWYYVQIKSSEDFLNYHFFTVGTRGKNLFSYFRLNFKQPLFYIHMGIRKWYYFWLLSLVIIVVSFRFLKKNVLFLLIWTFITLYPFLTSEKTELWHLIPVYLPIAFTMAYAIFELFKFIFRNEKVTTFVYLSCFLIISFIQIKTFLPEVIPTSKYIDDEVGISKKLTKYNGNYILVDQILPRLVFYSGKKNIRNINDNNVLKDSFSSQERQIYVMSNWILDGLKKDNVPFTFLEKNNTFSIIENHQ